MSLRRATRERKAFAPLMSSESEDGDGGIGKETRDGRGTGGTRGCARRPTMEVPGESGEIIKARWGVKRRVETRRHAVLDLDLDFGAKSAPRTIVTRKPTWP